MRAADVQEPEGAAMKAIKVLVHNYEMAVERDARQREMDRDLQMRSQAKIDELGL